MGVAQDVLEEARQLLEQSEPERAYHLLLDEFDSRRGDPDYDLLLGISALDSGHTAQAVFALERVIVRDPDNPRARAELARAYYELGENEAARQEFNRVRRREDLPSGVAQTIDQYLTAIETRVSPGRDRLRVYVEGLFGYDSNVNSATDLSTVALPAFGNLIFQVNQTGREQGSPFVGWAAGMNFSVPVSQRLNAFGSARIGHRQTYQATDFRQLLANGRAGLSYQSGDNRFVASLNGQQFRIGGDVNQEQAGGMLQYVRTLTNNTQLSAYGQFAALRYPSQPVRDVDQYTGGVNMVHLLNLPGTPVLFGGVYVGTEDEQNPARPDVARDFWGLRIGAEYNYNDKTRLFADAGVQYSDYGQANPLFLRVREDDYYNIGVGVGYSVTDNLSIRPEVRYQRNDSTLPINDYDRWQAFVTIRNTF